MTSVPAFCDTCGTVFHSGIVVENSTNISFAGHQSGRCPKCGGMGHVPDGVFNFIGDTIEILSAPERTIKELTQLAQIIKTAKEQNETSEKVAARIEQETPALSKLAALLPKNRSELYGFLALILAALQLVSQPSQSTQTSITINVNQVIEQVIQAPIINKFPNPPVFKKKIGRNEQCPCGSGKKYKKCCGNANQLA